LSVNRNFLLTLFCFNLYFDYFSAANPAIRYKFFHGFFFYKAKKELPLVAFFYQ